MKMEVVDQDQTSQTGIHPYPLRKRRCTSYMSPMGSSDVDLHPDLLSDDDNSDEDFYPVFDHSYEDSCSIDMSEFQKSLFVKDTKVKLLPGSKPDPTYCRKTLPPGLIIKQSNIRQAGVGVFAAVDFPPGTIFGPYRGEKRKLDSGAQESGFAWQICKQGKPSHFIDGIDPCKSNWMRYINCARHKEEHNVTAYQSRWKIYYRAHRFIPAGTEILVYYGDNYAEDLGIRPWKSHMRYRRLPLSLTVGEDSNISSSMDSSWLTSPQHSVSYELCVPHKTSDRGSETPLCLGQNRLTSHIQSHMQIHQSLSCENQSLDDIPTLGKEPKSLLYGNTSFCEESNRSPSYLGVIVSNFHSHSPSNQEEPPLVQEQKHIVSSDHREPKSSLIEKILPSDEKVPFHHMHMAYLTGGFSVKKEPAAPDLNISCTSEESLNTDSKTLHCHEAPLTSSQAFRTQSSCAGDKEHASDELDMHHVPAVQERRPSSPRSSSNYKTPMPSTEDDALLSDSKMNWAIDTLNVDIKSKSIAVMKFDDLNESIGSSSTYPAESLGYSTKNEYDHAEDSNSIKHKDLVCRKSSPESNSPTLAMCGNDVSASLEEQEELRSNTKHMVLTVGTAVKLARRSGPNTNTSTIVMCSKDLSTHAREQEKQHDTESGSEQSDNASRKMGTKKRATKYHKKSHSALLYDPSEGDKTLEKAQFGGKKNKSKRYHVSNVCFTDSHDLKRHIASHTEKKCFPCPVCNRKLAKAYALKMHMNTHLREKPFKCGTCGVQFSSQCAKAKHVKSHQESKLYECDECHVRVRTLSCLKQHKFIHTGEKLFKCDTCGKSFFNRSGCFRHVRTHVDVRPFECRLCNLWFTQSGHLKKHIVSCHSLKEKCKSSSALSRILDQFKNKHLSENHASKVGDSTQSVEYASIKESSYWNDQGKKLFPCSVCKKNFTRTNLIKHMRIHTGERPYECKTCGAKFAHSSNLRTHEKRHAGDKPYLCRFCSYGFVTRYDLTVHEKRHMTHS